MSEKEIDKEIDSPQNPIFISTQVAEDGEHIRLVMKSFNMITMFEMPKEGAEDFMEGLQKDMARAKEIRDKEIEPFPKDGEDLEE